MCGITTGSRMRTTRRKVDKNQPASGTNTMRLMKNAVSQSSGYLTKKVSSMCTDEVPDWSDYEWTKQISECPIFHPSIEEFENPSNYLEKIAPEASEFGICKIVSPLKAAVQAAEVLQDFEFSTYVQPLRLADWDAYDKIKFLIGGRRYNYNAFKSTADERFFQRFHHCRSLSPEQLEKKFWQEMFNGEEGTVEYAVNVDGSAFSNDPKDQLGSSKWNLKTFPKLPCSVLRLVEHEVPGITYPMLYIGMLFSMFAWHVEDHYLYSINYHHCGAPKTWYGVPGHAALQLEKVVLDHVYAHDILFPVNEDGAFEEIAGKTTLFPPSILLQHCVPVYKAVQKPGEFVVTFPRAYHAGFSNGFNCGEAVNFAMGDWFPFGAAASKRYACLGMPAILPYEELLCKEMIFLTKQESLNCTSAKLSGYHSVTNSFITHLRGFNNALWHLFREVPSLISSAQPLPSSHGSIICSTCKRDGYLAFLECSCCYSLLCLFHDVDSLDCSCGGTRTLFVREDLWYIEESTQKLEEEGSLVHGLQPTRHEGNISLMQNLPSDIQSGCTESVKQDNNIQLVGGGSNGSACYVEKNGDLDMMKHSKRGCQEAESLKHGSCKRIRIYCRHKDGTKFRRYSASEVPSGA